MRSRSTTRFATPVGGGVSHLGANVSVPLAAFTTSGDVDLRIVDHRAVRQRDGDASRAARHGGLQSTGAYNPWATHTAAWFKLYVSEDSDQRAAAVSLLPRRRRRSPASRRSGAARLRRLVQDVRADLGGVEQLQQLHVHAAGVFGGAQNVGPSSVRFFFAHFVGTELGASARFDRVSMLSSAGALGSKANAEARAAKARRRKTLDGIWTGRRRATAVSEE